jgi:hypothetical protein
MSFLERVMHGMMWLVLETGEFLPLACASLMIIIIIINIFYKVSLYCLNGSPHGNSHVLDELPRRVILETLGICVSRVLALVSSRSNRPPCRVDELVRRLPAVLFS